MGNTGIRLLGVFFSFLFSEGSVGLAGGFSGDVMCTARFEYYAVDPIRARWYLKVS